VVLVFLFVGSKGASIIFPLALAAPLALLSVAIFQLWDRGAYRRTFILLVAGAPAIVIGAFLLVIGILKFGEFEQDTRTKNYIQKQADQITYDIYAPNGKIPGPVELTSDGPTDNTGFNNPKTGTNNLGVAVVAGSRYVVYDKRNIPEGFGNCAPEDVRNSYKNDEELVRKHGCMHIGASPGGRMLYAIERDGENYLIIFDLDNSRIVLTTISFEENPLPPDSHYVYCNDMPFPTGKWCIPHKLGEYVDSFEQIPLRGIAVTFGNHKTYTIN
jgi:hypothetical protein